jgi:hypothetical protein
MLRILLKCSGQKKWTGGFCSVYIGVGCFGIRRTAGNISLEFVDQNMDMFLNNGGLEGGIGSQ